MIYNPFMPSVRFLDHAVFGGGGGGSPAPGLPPVSVGPVPKQDLISTFPELVDERYNTVQERIDAETKVTEERRVKALNKTAAETAGSTATDYASGITTDVSASAKAAQEETNRLSLELSSLKSQLDAAPKEGEPTLRDYKKLTTLPAGFKAPEYGFAVMTDFYNPTTGETVTVGSSGYTPAEGWIKGRPTGQFTEAAYNPQLKAAYDAKQKELEKAAQRSSDIGSILQAQMLQSQQNLMQDVMIDPGSVMKKAEVAKIDPNAAGTIIDPTLGQVGDVPTQAAVGATASTAAAPASITSAGMTASTAADQTSQAMKGVTAEQGAVSNQAQVSAATTDPSATAVGNLTAAQGTANIMTNPVQREIQAGELISGAADADKAAAYTEQVQAATASPSDKATVQGQLSGLMQDFEGGNTPAWAAGAMRAANTAMISRGLGASSMAGQAIVQAAMEAALPIAAADAQTVAGFEMQNLSNRQQRAMLAAQQRATFIGQEFDQDFQSRVSNAAKISDVANMNFTADQQIALENSRVANTMNLANLTNNQAMVMAQASSISQLETQNLSNQQQAAVQNAQNFLTMDMTNLSNRQSIELFKAQSMQQTILTDVAAENAAKQFNATSENQTKQFLSSLNSQVSQFNASQATAISQFNAGETNANAEFVAKLQEQRNQFNATNSLAIAQANAVWRQNVGTLNAAADNQANAEYAKLTNGLTAKTVDEIWQRERDVMDMYFNSEESAKDRVLALMVADKEIEANKMKLEYAEERDKTNNLLKMFFPKGFLGLG
mgnify:CR=1 FL=1|tara:strand:- start:2198 stop:4540 length:2343 start_codon:yes stop_codon:yes gene_type:complete